MKHTGGAHLRALRRCRGADFAEAANDHCLDIALNRNKIHVVKGSYRVRGKGKNAPKLGVRARAEADGGGMHAAAAGGRRSRLASNSLISSLPAGVGGRRQAGQGLSLCRTRRPRDG